MPLALGAVADLLDPDSTTSPTSWRAAASVLAVRSAWRHSAGRRRTAPRYRGRSSRSSARSRVDGPVLVAIDDVQWLDPASQRILSFAARRLGDAPVGILTTQRGDTGDPLDLRHALDQRFAEIRARAAEPRRAPPSDPDAPRRAHSAADCWRGSTRPPAVIRCSRSSSRAPWRTRSAAARSDAIPALASRSRSRAGRSAARRTSDALLASSPPRNGPRRRCLQQSTRRRRACWNDAVDVGAVAIDDDGVVRFTHPLLGSAAYAALPDRNAAVHARARAGRHGRRGASAAPRARVGRAGRGDRGTPRRGRGRAFARGRPRPPPSWRRRRSG